MKIETKMLKAIFKSIHDIITTKHEEVIQIVDVLEYFIKIFENISWVSLLKYALKLLLEILKGDFIIKGERPFKSFYWVVFYLCNGFKRLDEILNYIWLPMEIQRL